MVTVRALRQFQSTSHGNIAADQIVPDVPPGQAAVWVQHKLAEIIGSEASDPGPFGGSGEATPPSSSQAAPVSPPTTADTPPSAPASSPSTPATSGPESPTSSTPATAGGGTSTSTKSRKARSSGRKTPARQQPTD